LSLSEEESLVSRVAVIMNYFNGHEYLEESLGSLIKQKPPFTLYFVNNASPVDPTNVLNKFKAHFPIKYLHLKQKVKLYEARNIACGLAVEPFISFLDVDDVWKEGKLEIQAMEHEISGAALSFTWFECFSNVPNGVRRVPHLSTRYGIPVSANELASRYSVAMSSVMVSRAAFEQLEGFDSSYEVIGDFDLVLRASEELKVVQIRKSLVRIRLHSLSTGHLGRKGQAEELSSWVQEKAAQFNQHRSLERSIEAETSFLHYLAQPELAPKALFATLKNIRTPLRGLAVLRVAAQRLVAVLRGNVG